MCFSKTASWFEKFLWKIFSAMRAYFPHLQRRWENLFSSSFLRTFFILGFYSKKFFFISYKITKYKYISLYTPVVGRQFIFTGPCTFFYLEILSLVKSDKPNKNSPSRVYFFWYKINLLISLRDGANSREKSGKLR